MNMHICICSCIQINVYSVQSAHISRHMQSADAYNGDVCAILPRTIYGSESLKLSGLRR